MKSSLTTQILQASITFLTLFTTASEGLTQSLSYVQGVAIESSYSAPSLPFNVKAVYGDFRNLNPIWVQLWKQGGDAFTYALVWQVKVTPQVGDGKGEWVQVAENSQVTIRDTYRLGLVNDVIPGPLLQEGDIASEIILSVEDVARRGTDQLDLDIGEEVAYDDLTFPYHIPLYLCNTSDCIYIRSQLGRAELPMNTTAVSESTTDAFATGTPRVQESDSGSEDAPLALYIWLAVLSFILLLVILVLVCVFALIKNRDRREGPYRYSMPLYGSGFGYANNAHLNPAYSTIPGYTKHKVSKPSSSSSGCSSATYTKASIPGALNKGNRLFNNKATTKSVYDTGAGSRLSSIVTGSGKYTHGTIGSHSKREQSHDLTYHMANPAGSASSGMTEYDETDSFDSCSTAYYNSNVIKF